VVDRDLSASSLLGRHVERRADDIAAGRQALLSFEVSEAEVEDAQVAHAVEDQVRWLDVAVDHALRVGVLQTARDVGEGTSELREVVDLVLRSERCFRFRICVLDP
jgi:hypothetical protein